MIELAVLGLLKEQDLHGYELKKRLGELLGSRGAMSFGSLYPALARLERGGLVKAVEAHTRTDSAVPSSGSLTGELAAFRARHQRPRQGGRSRKVYGITERGAAQLISLLTGVQRGDERLFAVQLAFCRLLAPVQRLELFQRRRDDVAARLAGRNGDGGWRDSRFDHYLRSLREHDTESTTHELAWLDRLIAEEHAAITKDTTS